MEVKKAPHADLEKRKPLFLQIGFVLVLASVLVAFEWSSYDVNALEGIEIPGEIIEDEMIPITKPMEVTPPPPPPAKIIDIIEIVEDGTEIEEEPFFAGSESDENDEIVFDIPVSEEIIDDRIFIRAEVMPTYPGGVKALLQFIANAIQYPQAAIDSNLQGRVYVQFVVSETGSVENVVIARGVHPSLDNEALRVVSGMPKWNPGMQGNKTVKVSYTVPINFSLR